MRFRTRLSAGATALFLACPATGHQDPMGDVHPSVIVESGHFAVYFTNNSIGDGYRDNSRPRFRILYTADGRLLAPRHQVKEFPDRQYPIQIRRFHEHRPNATILLPDGKKQIHALAWPEGTKVSMVESACLSPGHIAAALKLDGNREEFFVYLFPRERFAEPERFLIGIPETIYDFPTASNVVFANGRFWVAWVRDEELVLSSLIPDDGKPVEKILDGPADWNANLSLAAIGDRLCLAYHCSVNHQYPGTGTILTKFIKTE